MPTDETLKDWHEMRKQQKAKVTQTVIKRMGGKLDATVRAIASGEVTNPSYESVKRLSEYLTEQGA